MSRHGKFYVEASKAVDNKKSYTTEEAIKVLKSLPVRKFDETVEVAIKLNLDTAKSDQTVRSSMVLPNGTGKSKKILVITSANPEEILKAGATYVGSDEYLLKIEKENWFDFDIMVASPEMMVKLGKLGKVLGPKGLMPNPKTGTVTPNVIGAVENINKGMIEFRTDTNGNVHSIIGKSSFSEKQLLENLKAFLAEINKVKPSGAKGTYITNVSISSTMGPGIKIDTKSIDK
ncbi:MAG: 50S ribosomal protein L1 [Bacilli bacterium]